MIVFCQRKRQIHCLWVGKRPSGGVLLLYDLMIIHFSILVQLLKFSAEIVFRSQQIRIENSKWKMEAGPMGRRELEYLDSALASNLRQKDDNRRKKLKLRNVKGQSKLDGLDSPTFIPRGSILHRKGNAHWETIILCQARLLFQLTWMQLKAIHHTRINCFSYPLLPLKCQVVVGLARLVVSSKDLQAQKAFWVL